MIDALRTNTLSDEKKHDINITKLPDDSRNCSEEELRALDAGGYGIEKIQGIYDALYDKGAKAYPAEK